MELLSLVDWTIIYACLPPCLLPLCTNSVPEKLQFFHSYCSLLFYPFLRFFFWLFLLLKNFLPHLTTCWIPTHPVKHLKCNSMKPCLIEQERPNYSLLCFFTDFACFFFSPQLLGMQVEYPERLMLTLTHCSQPFLSRYILSYLFYVLIILIPIQWHSPVIFFNKPLCCKVFIT